MTVEIQKRFTDFTLDVAFEAGDGALGILGASGSGKSMTLRCIAGVEAPDSGEIICNGKTLFSSKRGINIPARKRNMGLLFQSYALFPHMTAAQNIAAGVRDKALRAELTARYVALLRLEGLEGRYPAQLSGGQQQRVAIARMMAAGPDALMLDEPFSALDRHLRITIEQAFSAALGQFEGTVLYVSHNVNEIYQYCSDVIVLERGLVAERGQTERLFHTPSTVEGARLTGYKNITAVQRGKTGAFAPAWSCSLPLVLPEGANAVGVRDDGMELSEMREGGTAVSITHVRSFPRYHVLHLLPEGARLGPTFACPHAETARYVELAAAGRLFLHFKPEALLALRNTE